MYINIAQLWLSIILFQFDHWIAVDRVITAACFRLCLLLFRYQIWNSTLVCVVYLFVCIFFPLYFSDQSKLSRYINFIIVFFFILFSSFLFCFVFLRWTQKFNKVKCFQECQYLIPVTIQQHQYQPQLQQPQQKRQIYLH